MSNPITKIARGALEGAVEGAVDGAISSIPIVGDIL
jgi:hypothetical protein